MLHRWSRRVCLHVSTHCSVVQLKRIGMTRGNSRREIMHRQALILNLACLQPVTCMLSVLLQADDRLYVPFLCFCNLIT